MAGAPMAPEFGRASNESATIRSVTSLSLTRNGYLARVSLSTNMLVFINIVANRVKPFVFINIVGFQKTVLYYQ